MKKQLINVLIVKSILETVLVGTIALVFHVNAFPPSYRGWGEAVPETQTIQGWAVNHADPYQRVEVQLFIDGKFRNKQIATYSRPDVAAAGWARDEWHGYIFVSPKLDAGKHEARVYALHSSGEGARYTLQLLGDPIRFEIKNDGSWTTDSR
ncbi:MAG TPA: hypothetical protein VFR78_08595 [Pyrinomonadaceae bacterium]|nr:hypothetical protein [Pyrinomonadaceae bacterium]